MLNHVLGIATKVIVMAIVISIILLFLGIGVLVLIHVCIVGRTLRGGLNEMNVNIVERGSFGSTSMSQDDIEKLPCFDFKAKEKGTTSPVADCAICLENFDVGEKCRLLPSCNHSFHAECVDLWLLRTAICPICRGGADIVRSSESLFGDEEFSENGIELIELRGDQRIEDVIGNEVNSAGVDVGLIQTLENVDPSVNCFSENHTSESTWDLNEVVIEKEESHNMEDTN